MTKLLTATDRKQTFSFNNIDIKKTYIYRQRPRISRSFGSDRRLELQFQLLSHSRLSFVLVQRDERGGEPARTCFLTEISRYLANFESRYVSSSVFVIFKIRPKYCWVGFEDDFAVYFCKKLLMPSHRSVSALSPPSCPAWRRKKEKRRERVEKAVPTRSGRAKPHTNRGSDLIERGGTFS